MTDLKRRRLLSLMSTGAVAVPLSAVVASLPSHADELEVVDPGSPAATQYQYMSESNKADQMCSNCQLYSGKDGDMSGPCAIFPDAKVRATGWCSVWNLKA